MSHEIFGHYSYYNEWNEWLSLYFYSSCNDYAGDWHVLYSPCPYSFFHSFRWIKWGWIWRWSYLHFEPRSNFFILTWFLLPFLLLLRLRMIQDFKKKKNSPSLLLYCFSNFNVIDINYIFVTELSLPRTINKKVINLPNVWHVTPSGSRLSAVMIESMEWTSKTD